MCLVEKCLFFLVEKIVLFLVEKWICFWQKYGFVFGRNMVIFEKIVWKKGYVENYGLKMGVRKWETKNDTLKITNGQG